MANDSQMQPATTHPPGPEDRDSEHDPIVTDIERALVPTEAGQALIVSDSLYAAMIEYVVAATDHRDASESVMALAHTDSSSEEVNVARRRIISADNQRDQRARELADEILTALGIPG